MSINVKRPDVANRFVEFCLSKGLTPNGTAGAAGNICHESGFAPNNLQNSYNTAWKVSDEEYTALVNTGIWQDPVYAKSFASDSAGYGLCQWTSSGRKQGLLNLALNTNRDIDDPNVQFEHFWDELTTVKRYKNVYETLKDPGKSIEECAEVFVCEFEVPKSVIQGGEARQNAINVRSASAKEFYDIYINNLVGGEPMVKPILAINAGHWLGNPKGVPSFMPVLGGTLEWTLNCRVVDAVVKALQNYEISIIKNYDETGLTKTGNELSDRIEMAEKAKANIYLSIHHNGAANITGPTWTGGGTTVYAYNTAKNKAQAKRIRDHIVAHTGLVGNRSGGGVANGNNYMEVAKPTMDSFIIECAFMNSVTDIQYIARADWADNVAAGIVDFLIEEFKLAKKSNVEVVETTPVVETVAPIVSTATDFKVKCSETLPIYNETGNYAAKGVYTIVEEKNGMGKLKSGMGWVNLSKTTRV